MKTGNRLKVLEGHCDIISSICIYNNQFIISTDLSSLVVVWNIRKKFKVMYELTLHSDDVYKSLVLNDHLYTCSKDGSIVVRYSKRY